MPNALEFLQNEFAALCEDESLAPEVRKTASELWRFLRNYLQRLPITSVSFEEGFAGTVEDPAVWLWEINETDQEGNTNFECDIYFTASGLTDWYIATNGMTVSLDGPLHRILPLFTAAYRFKDLPMTSTDYADN